MCLLLQPARRADRAASQLPLYRGTGRHFYATRDVDAGQELVFDYGADYWDALGVRPL